MPPSIRVLGPLVALVFSAGLWAGQPRPLLARDPGRIEDPPPSGREKPPESAAMFPRAVRPGGPLGSPGEADGTRDASSEDSSRSRVELATLAEPLPAAEGNDAANRPNEPAFGGAGERGGRKDTDRSPAARGAAAVTPLPPPGQGGQSRDASSAAHRGGPQGLLTVVSSLGVVLGLFLVVAWAMRRATPGQGGLVPGEVVEVLGKAPLAGRQQLHLIRLGNKLVLLSVTPAGAEALSEVTEPEEVQRLTGLCRQAQPNSSTAMFRQVLRQFTGEHERARLGSGRDNAGREGHIRGEGNDG